jgi:hypothetical protein
MDFPYGISEASLRRWECFLRIREVQQRRGPGVGRSALRQIVDLELQAILKATSLAEHGGVGVARRPVATRGRRWSLGRQPER